MGVISLDMLAVIVDALSPLISVVLAVTLFSGVSLAIITPFLFVVRAGMPRV